MANGGDGARFPEPCERCGGTEWVPIIYGMPDGKLGERAKRGEVILAGCVIIGDPPTHACRSCGRRVGQLSDR